MLVSDRQLIGADQRIERRKEISVKAGTAYIKAHRFDESSAAYASRDYTKLGARFHKDGYIFIKNFLPKGLVTLVSFTCHVCQMEILLLGHLRPCSIFSFMKYFKSQTSNEILDKTRAFFVSLTRHVNN